MLSYLEAIPSFSTQAVVERFEDFTMQYSELEIDDSDVTDTLFRKIWDEVQNRFRPVHQRMLDQASMDANSDSTSSRGRTATPPPTPSPRRLKLKDLPLPTYSGDIAERRSFWRRFTNMMEDTSVMIRNCPTSWILSETPLLPQ